MPTKEELEKTFKNAEPAATHLIPLAKAWDMTSGDVLELGTGYFSTLFLHWLATTYGRHVYSFESSAGGWYDRAKKHESRYHHIIHCDNWDMADIDRHWGMAFVDHSPDERRHVEIKRLKDCADLIVVHDTEPERNDSYGYAAVLDLFKYRYDYKKILPWTSILSNFIDLSELK
jgi:hypothetical protein